MVSDRHAFLSTLLTQLDETVAPRVIVYVEGGLVRGIKADRPINVSILDRDNINDSKDDEERQQFLELEKEYCNLPESSC